MNALEARVGASEPERRVKHVEVEVQDRWDALALSETLLPYHSFLVQVDRQRWVVHARVGCHGERLDGALGKIKEWLADRWLEDVTCRVDGHPYELKDRERSPTHELFESRRVA